MNDIKDLTGLTFGLLTVTKRVQSHVGGKWLCLCSCGNAKILHSTAIIRGAKSCGCVVRRKYKRRAIRVERSLFNRILYMYNKNAKRRGLLFELCIERFSFLICGICHYCGAIPSNMIFEGNGYFKYNGVDRLDSSIGYTDKNCVTCCAECNWMKKAMSAHDFIRKARAIAEHTSDWGEL